jgi:mono/diheme cytochrome c family protein
MKKIVQFICIATSTLLVSSCYNDQLPEVPLPANVSFNKDVQGIFNKNCAGCHKDPTMKPNLSIGNAYNSLMPTDPATGDTYVIPGDAASSELFQAITGNGMQIMPPNGALSNSKIAILEKWINDGAAKN